MCSLLVTPRAHFHFLVHERFFVQIRFAKIAGVFPRGHVGVILRRCVWLRLPPGTRRGNGRRRIRCDARRRGKAVRRIPESRRRGPRLPGPGSGFPSRRSLSRSSKILRASAGISCNASFRLCSVRAMPHLSHMILPSSRWKNRHGAFAIDRQKLFRQRLDARFGFLELRVVRARLRLPCSSRNNFQSCRAEQNSHPPVPASARWRRGGSRRDRKSSLRRARTARERCSSNYNPPTSRPSCNAPPDKCASAFRRHSRR